MLQLNQLPFILSILSVAITSLYSAPLKMYRIRTDQEHYFRTDDHKVTPFWNEWNNRTTFDTTCSRFIAAIPKDDGNVKITLKSALTSSHVYLLIDLKYSKKAPTVSSMDVPMDGFAIYIAKQTLTALQPSTNYGYTLVSTVLSQEEGSTAFWSGTTQSMSGTSASEDMCSELIDIDSTHRVFELKLPVSSLYNNKNELQPGTLKAIDVRYYPSSDKMGMLTFSPLKDSTNYDSENRIYLNELLIDTSFNRKEYVFTSPGKNDTLITGTYFPVTWGSTVSGGIVSIDYSNDNGASWQYITPSTENNDSYSWLVPATPIKMVLLRIKSGNEVVAQSAPFSTSYPCPSLNKIPDTISYPILSWKNVVNANGYKIIIDTTKSFSHPVIIDTVGTAWFSPRALVANHRYYWKVSSNLDYAYFSPVDSFFNLSSTSIITSKSKYIQAVRISNNRVHFNLITSAYIQVELISVTGKVISLLDKGFRKGGNYEVPLLQSRIVISDGTYIVRLQVNSTTVTSLVQLFKNREN